MFNLVPITKEHDLNKLIREQRTSGERLDVLFISEWDPVSSYLMDELTERQQDLSGLPDLYIVNSFDTPHSFMAWNVTSTPSLVQLKRKGKDRFFKQTTQVTDIYVNLRLERMKRFRISRV